MSARTILTATSLAIISIGGCGADDPNAPPTIRLGDSVCDQCGMIISDARFATATIVEGDRGPEAALFDDFNCQIGYETRFLDNTIHARWSRDHGTEAWLDTTQAWFIRSPALRTPMASNMAAFANKADAAKAAEEFDGVVIDFKNAWKPATEP